MTEKQREALLNALYEIKCVCDDEYYMDDDCWEHCPLGDGANCMIHTAPPSKWSLKEDTNVTWRAFK